MKPRLTPDERKKLSMLRKRAEMLDRRIMSRDHKQEEALKKVYGERYVDYEQAEVDSIWWAVRFIQENSNHGDKENS